MRPQVSVLTSKTVFSGKLICVTVDRIVEPGGITARREIVHHPGSVALLPRIDPDRIVLVRQYRYAAGQSLWELAAGGLEPGESTLEAAARELAEETGYRAQSLRPLVSFYPSPGILNEEMHLIKASGLTRGRSHKEADERIRTRAFTLRDLREMIAAGKIHDGKTLVGLLWVFAGL